jgi:hypothetical protein
MRIIAEPVIPFLAAALESAAVPDPFWQSENQHVREQDMYQLAFELDVENATACY